MPRYSRYKSIEKRKNLKRTLLYLFLTFGLIVALIFYGIPALVKISALVLDLKQQSEPITQDDITPPAPPKLFSLPDATNSSSVEIEGSSEAGSTVVFNLNGNITETLTNNEGRFYQTLNLKLGENMLILHAVDMSGNESQKSQTHRIIYDNTPPELEITSPDDGQEFFGSRQRQIQIEGNTDPGSRVTINNRVVIVDENGRFGLTTTLSEGENNFRVKSTDIAGNETEAELTVYYVD